MYRVFNVLLQKNDQTDISNYEKSIFHRIYYYNLINLNIENHFL